MCNMKKEEILDNVARDTRCMDICRMVTGKQADRYADDLFQEVFIIISSLAEDRLQRIFSTCFHCFYHQVAKKQFCSTSSAFHTTNRKPGAFVHENADTISALIYDCDASDDDRLRKLARAIDELSFVESGLLKLYAERTSIKQVAKDSGVPVRSVYKIIAAAKKNVQLKVKRYNRTEQ